MHVRTGNVPVDFVGFMIIVNGLIEQGEPATLMESDDLIQCHHTSGGLVNAAEQVCGFELMDGENYDHDRFSIKWYYLLTKSQIKDIAAGDLLSLTMWRCSANCGRRSTLQEWCCPKCDFSP
jgi:hypothetical protein